MLYQPNRRPLAEITADLARAALGGIPADTVIKNGRLVNVHTAEILTGRDIAIKHGRVVLIGSATHATGPETEVIDAAGCYLVPGFLDGHIHVESSMVTVTQYARAVVPHGTTAIFMDPHEIANVLGTEGIRLMMKEGENLPLKVFTTMPSCVPAAPCFEDAGASIGPAEVAEAMTWPGMTGLGEMMNFPGVLAGDPLVHGELKAALDAGKVVTGHYAVPDIGAGLNAYVAAGISCCHESTRPEDALARMRLGMYAQIREGSAWHDLHATIKCITESRVDSRLAMLVSDDTHPETLLTLGHMNHVVHRAIQEGVDPLRAVQMATINTAQYFGVARNLGSIAPGRCADILFVPDLAQMKVDRVMVDGVVVAEAGRMLPELPPVNYPEAARHSVRLRAPVQAGDFVIAAPSGVKNAAVRVIEVIEARVGTLHRQLDLPVKNGELHASRERDVAKAACIERHGGPGNTGLGLVRGFGLQSGAVASTVAHDSHNLLVLGMNDADMALAANTLAGCGGGMTAVKDGRVLALLPLPIAGLMSDRPVEEVQEKVSALDRAWKELGCTLVSPFMTMALLSLPVLPELRLTNRGLVDTVNFRFVDLCVS
ncbi:adenine deaminase [Desulfotomaculum copahuensis]|uniref:Adenine deaminase n=1 Tax=Desulfotomaculum copahuensis TaxID=1838280 RepID=A0A1B7LDL1_9FIRM|nr:adenine deaminase [Desulfotomaculum copahuensis]OAT81177.1 adenine deaminase [Desulfotomaculum copahuensis]